MLASLLVVFREMLEAGLIVGIVLAATKNVPHHGRWVVAGAVVGIVSALIVASFAGALSATFQGVGQEIFNAGILGLAVLMLGWHTIWMARHGRDMAQQMREMGEAVTKGERSLLGLAIVVMVAILREGSEVALFLYGIATSTHDGPLPLLLGGAMGLTLGALVSWLLYRGLLFIPVKRLFRVTGLLIALLAAGMAGQAAAILEQANLLPALGEQLWDTSRLLSDKSLLGRALHALIGYSAHPPGVQVLAYTLTLGIILALTPTSYLKPSSAALSAA